MAYSQSFTRRYSDTAREIPHLLSAALAFAPALIAIVATLSVLNVAWISDDAYITARYADNLLRGYGPVFNAGEHVQGFTHPLWLALFTPCLAVLGQPLLVAVALGTFFTLATFVVIWRALLATGARREVAAVAIVALGLLLALSEAWRSFQTSGLETSLTHFLLALIVLETLRADPQRSWRLTLLAGLLVLTRPDFAVLIGPLSLYVLVLAVRRRHLLRAIAGFTPLLVWGAFAELYYGSVIPNTATTKLGTFGLIEGIRHGLTDAGDWALYEPGMALAVVCAVVVAIRCPLKPAEKCLLLGVVLYAGCVIVGGGDFMRGRMLLPVVFLLLLVSTVALLRLSTTLKAVSPSRVRIASLAGAVILLLSFAAPAQAGSSQDTSVRLQLYGHGGIIDERLFYQDQSLRFFLDGGVPLQYADENWGTSVTTLRAFAASCGSFAVEAGGIGALGYSLGPGVQLIDRYGLTDSVISHLPDSDRIAGSRPGHPRRMLPVSYLAGRGDIMLFSNWRDAVAAGACGIIAAARSYTGSEALISPFALESRPVYSPQGDLDLALSH
jgi:arabinofuranosyltransferase